MKGFIITVLFLFILAVFLMMPKPDQVAKGRSNRYHERSYHTELVGIPLSKWKIEI